MEASIENYQKDKGTFDVIVKNVKSVSGVEMIQVPVWCAKNQSDICWYTAAKQEDGTYKATVSMANHGYAVGTYNVHVYMTTKNGLRPSIVAGTQKVERPEVKLNVQDEAETETNYKLKVTNVGMLGNVKNVLFATWSEAGGQDDLVWYTGQSKSNGEWETTVNIKNHKTAGKYRSDVYAVMSDGSMQGVGSITFEVTEPGVGKIELSSLDELTGQFVVTLRNIESPSGIYRVQIPVWCSGNQSDICWYTATKQEDGSYSATIDPMKHGYHIGEYKVHVYVTCRNGVMAKVGETSKNVTSARYYSIMGDSTVTIKQMVDWYKSKGHTYPSSIYNTRGAENIEQFCKLYYEEAKQEGVRVEVAFAQAMKETGWLSFGGIVQASQCNFAGIGALDGNAQGGCATFPDVRSGIRAQIQHLKAYGSTEALKNTQVDPRFELVKRGSAKYVEWLGIQENPEHLGWATEINYGYDIVTMIRGLKSM